MAVQARGTVQAAAVGFAGAAPAASPAPAAAAAASASLLDLDDLFSTVTAAAGQGDLLSAAATPVASPPVAAVATPPPPPRPAVAPAASPLAGALAGLDDLLGAPAPAPAPAAAALPRAPPAAAAGTLGAAAARSAAQFDAVFGAAAAAAPASAPFPAAATAAAGAVPAPTAGGLGDLFGSPAPAPAPPAPPAEFVAFTSAHPGSGLRVTFACEDASAKAGAAAAGGGSVTDVHATFSVAPGGGPIANLVCQAAVPKSMRVTLQPASGSTLVAGGGVVRQLIRLENSQAPAKPGAWAGLFLSRCVLRAMSPLSPRSCRQAAAGLLADASRRRRPRRSRRAGGCPELPAGRLRAATTERGRGGLGWAAAARRLCVIVTPRPRSHSPCVDPVSKYQMSASRTSPDGNRAPSPDPSAERRDPSPPSSRRPEMMAAVAVLVAVLLAAAGRSSGALEPSLRPRAAIRGGIADAVRRAELAEAAAARGLAASPSASAAHTPSQSRTASPSPSASRSATGSPSASGSPSGMPSPSRTVSASPLPCQKAERVGLREKGASPPLVCLPTRSLAS